MLNDLCRPYDEALTKILSLGVKKISQRVGQSTRSLFGLQTRYDLSTNQLPVLTRRKFFPKSIFHELLWFLSGSTNNHDLEAYGSLIWRPWESPKFEKQYGFVSGSLGPIYGFQLRNFGGDYGRGDKAQSEAGGEDQLAYMFDLLEKDPQSRRILFSLWNPKDLKTSRLPPCHYSYQVVVDDEKQLSGILTQRSCDYPIGCPANIFFYSLLTNMFAIKYGFRAKEFIHNCGEAHIYEDQIEGVKKYLSQEAFPSPTFQFDRTDDPFKTESYEEFSLINYQHSPHIRIPVAV